MKPWEENILNALIKNAATFLNCSVRAMNQGLHQYDNKVIAIVNLQMALELAVKAKIVKDYGVKYIIQNLDASASDAEIQEKYESNALKIKDFESLKNFLKSRHMFDDVSDDLPALGYIDCKICGMESSVIYDRLNLDNNGGMARGMCINCQSDTIIFKCPQCDRIFDFEGIEDKCTPEQCIYIDSEL